ncbi:MAG: undecaprenyldiphospho-muramoylpentapeptide beta-N-acetylglucosaminyltransferase [Peptococcaceae bacterium]|nr:undecaprenyldiphospho-muramoylpentapeptide beta-N-acetylglucosaminyltransferase [Peptococcaceae bacterium]
MRFIVAGGGTGGHIYPALAIAGGLKERYPGAEILYIGTSKGMEADIIPKEGLPFKGIEATGLQRKLTLRNFITIWQACRGLGQARGMIRSWRPDVVIGTGGYVCGPVILAAALNRIPTLIHEQNALPGLTNRLLARFATTVAVTFSASEKYFPRQKKIRLTGLPVRPEVLQAEKQEALSNLGIGNGRFVLLSFGGSRGARTINKAMVRVIKLFASDPRIYILHVTGTTGYEEFLSDCAAVGIDTAKAENFRVMSYVYNMQDALAAADLVVSRSGAATLAELTTLGIPAILVPYPYAAENHQEYNARALEKEGAARVVLDSRLDGDMLGDMVADLLVDRGRLSAMALASLKLGRKQALADIINCVDELIQSPGRQ